MRTFESIELSGGKIDRGEILQNRESGRKVVVLQSDRSARENHPNKGEGSVVGYEGERQPGDPAACRGRKSPPAKQQTAAQIQSSEEWQESLWKKWPTEDSWPANLSVYEAAAFMRIHPDSIRGALVVGRDGKARLAHQKWGAIFRIRRADLSAFGRVETRG